MTGWTATDIATAVLLVSSCGAAITGLILAGKWIWRRAEVTEFAHSITANPLDVARAQADNDACMELDLVIEELAEVLPRLREAS